MRGTMLAQNTNEQHLLNIGIEYIQKLKSMICLLILFKTCNAVAVASSTVVVAIANPHQYTVYMYIYINYIDDIIA